jgi:hypothetical protein
MAHRTEKSGARTPRLRYSRLSVNRGPGDALTIRAFCDRNTISESKYYSLKRQGRGPREIEIDNRIIITPESERDWRAAMEAETAARREVKRQATSANVPSVPP